MAHNWLYDSHPVGSGWSDSAARGGSAGWPPATGWWPPPSHACSVPAQLMPANNNHRLFTLHKHPCWGILGAGERKLWLPLYASYIQFYCFSSLFYHLYLFNQNSKNLSSNFSLIQIWWLCQHIFVSKQISKFFPSHRKTYAVIKMSQVLNIRITD